MDLDLETLSLKELRELRNKVDRAISGFEERKKREALAAAEEAVRQFGFNLGELTGGKTRKGSVVAPKYANPADASQTWTGRGRQPRWVKEHLEKNGSLDDLAI